MTSPSSSTELLKRLFAIVEALEEKFPGRHFTPDGHMVGSIGECLAAEWFHLKLMTASTEGYDATGMKDGREIKVEIKATFGDRVAFRSQPEHAIVIRLNKQGAHRTIFNGPGKYLSALLEKEPASNGQIQISIVKLKNIDATIPEHERLPETGRTD